MLRNQREVLVPGVQLETVLERVLDDHQVGKPHLVDSLAQAEDLQLDDVPCQALPGGANSEIALSETKIRFAFGDAVQHICIRRGWFGTEIAIIRRQIAEIFRNRAHRREWIVKSFQRTREGPVGNRQDFTRIHHRTVAFSPGPAGSCLPSLGSEFRTELGKGRYFFLVRL